MDERLLRMHERGEVRLGTGTLSDDFWSLPMPKDPDGEVMQALMDERNSERVTGVHPVEPVRKKK